MSCIDSGKLISNNSVRCRKCSNKVHSSLMRGENNPNYKHGKSNSNKCMDCEKRIDRVSKRCVVCSHKKGSRYKGGITLKENFCIDCGKKVIYISKRCKKCSNKNKSDTKYGKDNPNWRGGKSFEPYSIDWTETLRISIRERDGYVCQLCNKKQGDIAHDVHHIDYNKQNCNPGNLITLCHVCNSKVNFKREHWTDYFKNELINRGSI